MKYIKRNLVAMLILGLGLTALKAQEVIPASGGDASGGGSSVSCSYGQMVYSINTGTNGSVAEGVQQPYEISLVANTINISGTIDASTLSSLTTASNLIIEKDGMLTNNTGKTLTASSITIKSDANGTGTFVDNGTSTFTTATVQQYLTAGRNWYVSSPITTAAYSALSSAGSVQYWNEPAGVWSVLTEGNLNVGQGYISVATAATGNVTFNGTLNDGTVNVNLTRTKDAYKSGFNLVGNPYPSYVSWDAVLLDAGTTNIGTTIWYRTKTIPLETSIYTFDTYNSTSQIGTGTNGSVVTGNIPPMQAFWVRVNAAGDGSSTTGAIAFKNSMRAHKGSQLQGDAQTYNDGSLRAPSMLNLTQQLLRLQVSNGTNMDETVLLFNANASNGLDAYDSEKMNNNSVAVPEIYTSVGSEQLAINGLSSIPYNTEIPLGFTTLATGTFSIKASQFSNFTAGTQIILRDNTLNYEQDLTVADYSFTSDPISSTGRFLLVFRVPSISTGLNSSNSIVWITTNANGQIIVNGNATGKVVVYNAIGQKIASANLTNATNVLNNSLASGVYTVTVTNAGKSITQKVIIK